MTPRRVQISGLKGGVGKSTLTLNLATVATRASQRVLVVELDPQGNATTLVTGLYPDQVQRTIADVLVGFSEGQDPAELVAGTVLSAQDPAIDIAEFNRSAWGNLDVLPANQDVAGLALGPAHYRDLAKIMDAAGDGYDLILYDTAPGISSLTTLGAYAADSIISVTTPTANAVGGVRQLINGMITPVQQHHDVQLIGVVVNRVANRAEHRRHHDALQAELPHLLCRAWLPDRTVVEQAEGYGLPVHAMPGPSAVTLTDLYDKIFRYLITEATP
ncbi:ParA family protein [Pseudonocardia sp. Ae505_Ps2]|uniref:ParA family protein n=1 Tax=Pseudonocardia sp. Ae505_Ps2 TaxID=1885034 RepID=UPI000A076E04|nr:ParA family protein [Pseudonocardia sp. Ae505_Ps2]